MFFAGQLLENATLESARLILTRQAQNTAMTEADFKQNLCDRIKVMFNCQGNLGNLTVDIFFCAGRNDHDRDPIVAGSFTGTFVYKLPPSGSPNTIVVRAFYQWPLFVTQLGYDIGNLTGGKRLLSATAAFHVEP